MALFDHVLLAIDFSEPSEVAAKAAFKLCVETGARALTVVHVTQPVVLPSEREAVLRAKLEALQAELLASATAQVNSFCQRHDAGRTEVHGVAVAGRPADEVGALARSCGATLVVLGTHARRGIRRMFFGSIAEATVAHLNVPALVMHVGGDGIPPDVEISELDTVVVAVEVGTEAKALVEAALALLGARGRGGRVVLVHAIDSHRPFAGELHEAYTQALEASASVELRSLSSLVQQPFQVEMRVVHGTPSEVILDAANTEDAELVIIGERKGPLARLGSTGSELLRRSPVSVLVVPIPG